MIKITLTVDKRTLDLMKVLIPEVGSNRSELFRVLVRREAERIMGLGRDYVEEKS